MLDDLVQTIETLQRRIREHREYLGNYESRTRVALIDPMLCALGWDVSDPDAVQIEPRTVNGWADYALLGSNRRPVIFVEAKKLADQDSPIRQTVGYAVSENIENRTNVRYCASTNGDVWEVYDIIAQESVMRLALTRDDAAKCALQLLGLWRRSLQDGSFDSAVEPLVESDMDVGSVRIARLEEPSPLQREPTPAATQPSASVEIGWTPLTGDFETTGRPAPTAIRFPSGEEREIRNWRGIVSETVTWLHQRGVLTHEERQFRSGPKRYLFNSDGRHPNGGRFKQPIALGDTGIIVEGNISSYLSVRSTRRLLAHLGQDPSQVYLKLS